MWVSIASLSIAFLTIVFTILTFYFARKKDVEESKKEAIKRERELYERELDRIKQETVNTTSIKTKLEEICSQNNVIKDGLRDVNKMINEMSKNQSIHNEQMRQITEQLDDHELRIRKLEEK